MIAIESAIYADVFAAVAAFGAAQTPPLPVSFPGLPFTPPTGAGKFWLEVSVFPNSTLPYAWDDAGPNEYRGFVQVGVVRRPGAGGILPVTNMAAALIAALPKGFVAGDSTFTEEGSMSSVLIDDDWLTVPITFRYRALTKRAA